MTATSNHKGKGPQADKSAEPAQSADPAHDSPKRQGDKLASARDSGGPGAAPAHDPADDPSHDSRNAKAISSRRRATRRPEAAKPSSASAQDQGGEAERDQHPLDAALGASDPERLHPG